MVRAPRRPADDAASGRVPRGVAATRLCAGLLLAGLCLPGQAQTTRVPPILQAHAAASASVSGAMPTDQETAGSATAPVPAAGLPGLASAPSVLPAMPPPVPLLSPSAPLTAREQQAVTLARAWAEHGEMPQAGENGVVRFLYGATLPTVVCAPLQVCDLALQPGEIVNNVNLGDKVRWNVAPALSGSPDGQITHLIIKPADAGLISSMTIETNRRTYAVKLVATRTQWMPLIAFTYPDDMQRQWSAYRENVASAPAALTPPASHADAASLDFGFRLAGDHPPWRPLRVYTDGAKTYIQFPHTMASGEAPALVGLAHDGGWFSGPSPQMLTYRIVGDRYVVDRVLARAELVTGVGSGQARVLITRDGTE